MLPITTILNKKPPSKKRTMQERKKAPRNKVGQEEQNFGFGAGKAVRDSKPTRNISNLINIPKDEF